MATKEIVINTENLYVQGVIKIINDFMLEEASGNSYTTDRLKEKLDNLRDIFPNERKQMVIAGRPPIFSIPTTGEYKLVFTK